MTTTTGMTEAEVRALPVSIPLPVANRVLGLGRSKGYTLARSGQYPVRVLRVGTGYRVVTAELRTLLGITDTDA
ncbi:DNA-binding protein [Umezawaea beigongshangensis]|uniref:DNA-binding protein n=1 Tax=Umezawaea beigongshangensis TaxID=2780383 RepID=UPI0027DB84CE|nr:DNA-binding protein [Umezawaea beigongshangensis]